jgi:hypothetical protein
MCIKAMRKRKDPDSQSVDSDATDALEAQDEEEGEAPYPLPPTTPVSRARSLCRQTELVVSIDHGAYATFHAVLEDRISGGGDMSLGGGIQVAGLGCLPNRSARGSCDEDGHHRF